MRKNKQSAIIALILTVVMIPQTVLATTGDNCNVEKSDNVSEETTFIGEGTELPTEEAENITATSTCSHSFEACAGKDPTCSEEGWVEYACVKCWDPSVTYREMIPIDPQAHVWGDGVTIVAPTLETDGIAKYTCIECGETKEESVSIDYQGNDFLYTVNVDETLTITGYSGEETDIEIPYRINGKVVTVIGDEAFNGHGDLTSILIPDSVKSIGANAFCHCQGLEKVIIPNGVTSIGYWAFAWCTGLKMIELSDGVTSIGYGAFYNCISLSSIEIPDSVTEMGYEIFTSCKSLTSVRLSGNITEIKNDSFSSCISLINIEIPENVKLIGEYAFYGCTNLKSIYIPENLQELGNDVFSDCTNLTIHYGGSACQWNRLGYSFPRIEFDGSSEHSLVEEIVIQGSDSKEGKVQYKCKDCGESYGFLYYIDSNEVCVSGAFNEDGSEVERLVIPDMILGKPVSYIKESAFQSYYYISTVVLPDTLKEIRDYAFSYCYNLTDLTLPNSLVRIGKHVFLSCNKLTEITLPNSLTSIDENAFEGCTSLKSLYIPKNVERIGDSTYKYYDAYQRSPFYDCSSNLKIYTEWDDAPSGWNYEWYYTSYSSTAYVYYGIDYDSYLFWSKLDTSESSVTIPSTVKCIPDNAFYGTDLSEISLPKGLKSIGNYAFSHTKLQKIIIPSSVTSVGYAAFSGCSELKEIELPQGITDIYFDTFYECTSLDNISIPASVNSIGSNAFYNCDSLTRIELHEGLSYIEYNAFLGCSNLKSIVIPESIQAISENAVGMYYSNVTSTYKPIPDFIIYGFEGSAAQQYAKENGITFVSVGYNEDGSIHEHKVVVDDAVEPTCTENGYTVGKHCSECNKVLIAPTEIPAKGHVFTDYTYNNDATYISDGTKTAVCKNGCGATKTIQAEGTKKTLAQPVLKSVNNVTTGVTVTWNLSEGAKSYRVFYKAESSTSWSRGGDSSTGSYTVTGLTSGKKYFFTVRCIDAAGNYVSSYDKTGLSILYLSSIKPTLSNVSTGTTIKWTKVTGASGYYVYRKSGSGAYTKIKTITGGSTITYTDTTADSGVTYTYAVRAYNGSTLGYYSGVTGLYLSSIKPTLSNSSTGVTVKWTKVTGAAGYYVYRKSESGSYTKIKTITDGSTVTYTDTTAVSGTTYTYAVRAYNGSTLGYYTGVTSLYLSSIKPTLSNSSTGVTVKWTKVTGAAGYYVYRKSGSGSYTKIKTITNGSTISYTDASCTNGTAYTYAVRAYKDSIVGYYTAVSIYRLTGVSISSLTNSTAGKMTVKWTQNNQAMGYQIQYSTSSSFSGATTITASGSTTLSKIISSLRKGSTYYVRVRAYKKNSAGTAYYSGWSATKSLPITK